MNNQLFARVTLLFASMLASAVLAADKPVIAGAAPGQWTMDFDAARQIAAQKKLPLLLNFTGSDWCGWCKLMDKSVFSQAAWQAYAKERLMLVWIDFPKDKSLVPEKLAARNKALAEFFNVQGYPCYIILDDDGKTQLGQLGADRDMTPELFIGQLTDVLQDRAAEVEAFLRTLPAEQAQAFRTAEQQRRAAREELKKLEDAFEKRSSELRKQIDEQDSRLASLRLEARLAKLPPAAAETYRAKKTRHAAVTAELNAWIAGDPPDNEANMKKFNAWKSELAALEKEMRALLAP